jgi:hypothetical protein
MNVLLLVVILSLPAYSFETSGQKDDGCSGNRFGKTSVTADTGKCI